MTRLQFLQSFIAASFATGTGASAKLAEQTLPAPVMLSLSTAHPTEITAEEIMPDWLMAWQADEIIPITDANDDRMLMLLLSHQPRQQPLDIHYQGGTWGSSRPRKITPILLFEKAHYPATYLLAWCHERQQARTFLLDKITFPLIHATDYTERHHNLGR